MKKSGASHGQSASELISKRIAELGDWRGRFLRWRLVLLVSAVPGIASGAPNETLLKISGYVGAVAAPYFCSCGGWPASWRALQQFDDRMHAAAEARGQAPLARFPWSRYENSRISTNAKHQLVVDVVAPGIAEGTQIGFDAFDCSPAQRAAMKDYCPSTPGMSRP